MPKDNDNSTAAFQELVCVLEDAVRTGVDSIEMEYEDGEWIVYFRVGNTGLGGSRFSPELQWDVIAELSKRAGLSRKPKGKMQVRLLGKDYEAIVEEYDSFGESAYNIVVRERRKKTGR